jgi:aspartate kinase
VRVLGLADAPGQVGHGAILDLAAPHGRVVDVGLDVLEGERVVEDREVAAHAPRSRRHPAGGAALALVVAAARGGERAEGAHGARAADQLEEPLAGAGVVSKHGHSARLGVGLGHGLTSSWESKAERPRGGRRPTHGRPRVLGVGAYCAAARPADHPPPILHRSMSTVVMKFGGTSVGDAERLKRAAQRIVAKREAGHRVVAVLSARGKETDRLIADAFEVSPEPDAREMDMLLSTGERVSCALCAMAINDLGHRAISLTGSQAGIVTDTSHTKARILDVRADRIFRALEEDSIVLVAGFQGVSTARDVTTLGRGGSDTTAVALAAAVGAEVCEIYTDVPGVFSADPRIVPDARKLPVVSFEEMLEMAASGAGVLQLRSVEYARNHGVRIHCRSSFDEAPGTVVVSEGDTVEQPLITAVTHSLGEARVTLLGLPDVPGIAGRVTTALAEANVNIDMIIQNEPESEGAAADMSFTVPRDDVPSAQRALEPLAADLGIQVVADQTMGKVSIVGAGMKTHPGVAAKVFTTLGENDINIEMISTSPIRISCVVPGERVPDAVKALHAAFQLSGEGTIRPEQPFGEFAA